jgi:D-alanyl-D-alanine carboxypeptidase (penicillin-binding protein 5/6)
MRPPEHWHLRPQRRPSWPRWAIGAAAVLAVAALIAFLAWPSGDGTAAPPEAAGDPCPEGGCPAQGGGGPFFAGGATPPRVTARAASVIEASCGTPLYSFNAHLRLPPASLTKITTALVAAARRDLSGTVDVRVNSALLVASTSSTVMGLEPGMRMSLSDLLYGLLLPSGNDAAIAIAEHVGGSVPAFVELMNEKARALGLRDTHFANPHGLDEPGLYSSAYDMALLGRELLAQPELAAIVRTKSYQPAWDGPLLWNGNELLDLYPGTIGVKTGYTDLAGQSIVAAAERDGRLLIVSVLGGRDRYADAIALFDWAFATTEPVC